MKRVGYIYEKVYAIDNIKLAIMKSSLGKRDSHYVKKVIANINIAAMNIQNMLMNKTYIPSPYKISTVLDGANKKERTICKPRYYPDQIIHWALMLQLQPVIMKGMYKYNCGSIPERGTSYGQKTLRKWIDNDYKGTKYCLKMDISKFYPSIDNNILKQMFQNDLKDEECLWLINIIIDSAKGLPIGNYTSQWFSNYYLQNLDHFIKECLDTRYYIRYVDDLVILGGNKRKLHVIKIAIDEFLCGVDLRLKKNWQIFRIKYRAIDFLGFRFFQNKTILRKRNSLRIKRRIKKISKKSSLNYKDACAVISYWGWIKRSDSYNFYNKYIKPNVSLKYAKRTVSKYAKASSVRQNTAI